MLAQLANQPILYRFMAGGSMAIAVIAVIGRFFGWTIAGLLIGGLLIAAAVMWFFNKGIKLKRKKKASAFDKGLQADAGKAGHGKAEQRKAQGEIYQRWNQAVTELKRGGLNLYDLPWYLLIGEPQSGKSTTLRHSGLEFPVGTEALSGAGGTRNCDWWFTNEAVILDTAGRFTFQEKNAPDADEWKSFLKLLKKNRPACPINGVVVTIPLTSLLGDSPEEREDKARNLREKLTEIQRELEVQFPVFILLTKSDQILGFTEFFSRLGATEQRQLLGWSMHGPFIQAYDPDKFKEVFDSLYQRIHKWRNKIIGEDLSLTEVDKLYVFPEEFKSVRDPLHDYLKSVFVKTHYLPPLFFRGFYFTSGMQTGQPIAKACAQLLRRAGEGADEIVEHLQKIFERSRAFFIRDFYIEKLFPERNLVIHSEKKMKMGRKVGMLAVWGGAALLLLTMLFIVWRGIILSRGVGGIEQAAKVVKREFISDVSAARRDDPEPKETEDAAEAVKTASEFHDKSEKTVEKIGSLAPYLRDMYFLYFLQNSLRDQGQALYTQLAATEPGASADDEAINRLYRDYVRLWSLNPIWEAHALADEGRFKKAGSFKYSSMMQSGVTDKTQETFQDNLERLRDILGDKKESPNFEKYPVAIPIVPGHVNPKRNDVIRKEIEHIKDSFNPVEQDTVNRVVGRASGIRELYASAVVGLFSVPCGYPDPDTDPFTDARNSIGRIRDAIRSLDEVLAANEDLGGAMVVDEAGIKAKFLELTWVKGTLKKSEARDDLRDYILESIQEVNERFRDHAQKAKQPLEAVGDVIGGDPLGLSEGLGMAGDGLDMIEALAEAQNTMVVNVRERKPKNPDEVDQTLKEWRGNDARIAAESWATQAAGRVDLPATWQLPTLGNSVGQMVRQSDEAVHVEAWLAYMRNVQPGVLLSGSQISRASLGGDPPPGATAERVKSANDELADLAAQLSQFREGIECDNNRQRVRGRMESIAGVINANKNNFSGYWMKAFDRWHPAGWIESISSWKAFKQDDLMQGTALSQRVKQDLQRLVAHVKNYKDTVGSVGKLESIYSDLRQFVTPGSALENNANLFSGTIEEMELNELGARLQLEEPGQGGMTRAEAIESIAERSSSLNSKFRPYPDKVRALLGDPTEQFEHELGQFLAKWSKALAGKFPFAVPADQVVVEAASMDIPQVDAKLLRDFYYGPDSLEAFLGKYGPIYEKWSDKPANEAAKDFFDQCLRLKDYFLDPGVKDYRKLQLEGTYIGFVGKSTDDLRQISEVIRLLLPTSSTERKVARWRSQVEGDKTAFEWTPGDYGEEGFLVFESKLERGDRPNKAELRVGGDFSVLAYIVTQVNGVPEVERRKWPVNFSVQPENSKQDQRYMISFVFVFENSLPRLPDWGDVAKWTK